MEKEVIKDVYENRCEALPRPLGLASEGRRIAERNWSAPTIRR